MLDAVKEKAHPNFCDGLRHVLHLQHPHSGWPPAGCAPAAQAQSVLVLHDFEAFAARPKQTLLYSLFDLMQSEDVDGRGGPHLAPGRRRALGSACARASRSAPPPPPPHPTPPHPTPYP